MSASSPIHGKTILVVEDDGILGMLIQDDLEAHGARVIGPLTTCSDTLCLLKSNESFDAAILDIHLLDGDVYEAADLLVIRGCPFVFASSLTRREVVPRFASVLLFFKPLEMRRFFESLFST